MALNLLPYSRFAISDPIIVDGVETFGLFRRFKFLDPRNLQNTQILKFEVRPPFDGRPDRIADTLYGASTLDWVIILFNNPRDTLSFPINGTVIKYPVPSVVFAEIR